MEHSSALVEILSLMLVAVISATVFARLGFGTILGYLAGGMLIGPWGLGLFADSAQIAHIGEFGVVFLLFLIGIELKPARLWLMRRMVFGLGSGQLVITGLILSVLASVALGLEAGPAAIVGLGLALSSTAFGVQILALKNQLSSQWGRAGFSILLLQDLAVVPLLALVPLVAGEVSIGASLGLAILNTLVLLAIVIFIGRKAINPLFRLVAANKTPEVFTGFALLLVLGFSWFMEYIGLSMAMGAFIAGLLMSESEFKHQVEADIMPFRGLLLSLFFMAVGMGINFGAIVSEAWLVLGMLTVLLAVKGLVIVGLVRFVGLSLPEGVKTGALLAQAGEFGFVIFTYARLEGVLDGLLVEILSAVIALSMAATPLIFSYGLRFARRVANEQASTIAAPATEETTVKPVVIAGFGRVGEVIAHMLSGLKIPFVTVDLDPVYVKKARDLGYQAIYGDAARPEILRAAGAKHAALLVITVDDTKVAERILLNTKRECIGLPTYVRTHNQSAARMLQALGATHTVPETLEASIRLGGAVARACAIKETDIQAVTKALRSDNYRALLTGEDMEAD